MSIVPLSSVPLASLSQQEEELRRQPIIEDPLTIAHAMRAAADFCEDPRSPKSPGSICVPSNLHPWEEGARAWCAIGYAEHVAGGLVRRLDCDSPIAQFLMAAMRCFDGGDYHGAARTMRQGARMTEAMIPTTSEPRAKALA